MVKTKQITNNKHNRYNKFELLKPLNIKPINLLDDDLVIFNLDDISISKKNTLEESIKLLYNIVGIDDTISVSNNKYLNGIKFYILNNGILYPVIIFPFSNTEFIITFNVNIKYYDNHIPMSIQSYIDENNKIIGYIENIGKYDPNEIIYLINNCNNNSSITDSRCKSVQIPYSGSQLIKTALKIFYVLNFNRIIIRDDAVIYCENKNTEIDLSLLKIVEKGRGFYNNYGFEYEPNQDKNIKEVQNVFHNYTISNMIEYCKNLISMITNIKKNKYNVCKILNRNEINNTLSTTNIVFDIQNNEYSDNGKYNKMLNDILNDILVLFNDIIEQIEKIIKSPYNILENEPLFEIIKFISTNKKYNCNMNILYDNIFNKLNDYRIYNFLNDYVFIKGTDLPDKNNTKKLENYIKTNKNIYGVKIDGYISVDNDGLIYINPGVNIFNKLVNIRDNNLIIKNLKTIYNKNANLDKIPKIDNIPIFYINLNSDSDNNSNNSDDKNLKKIFKFICAYNANNRYKNQISKNNLFYSLNCIYLDLLNNINVDELINLQPNLNSQYKNQYKKYISDRKINVADNIKLHFIYGNLLYSMEFQDDYCKINQCNSNSNNDINYDLYMYSLYINVNFDNNKTYIYNFLITLLSNIKKYNKNKNIIDNIDNIDITIKSFYDNKNVNYLLFDIFLDNKLNNYNNFENIKYLMHNYSDGYKNDYNKAVKIFNYLKEVKISTELIPKVEELLKIFEELSITNKNRKNDKNGKNRTLKKLKCLEKFVYSVKTHSIKILNPNGFNNKKIKSYIKTINNILESLKSYVVKIDNNSNLDNVYYYISYVVNNNMSDFNNLFNLLNLLVGIHKYNGYNGDILCDPLFYYDEKLQKNIKITLGYEEKFNGLLIETIDIINKDFIYSISV